MTGSNKPQLLASVAHGTKDNKMAAWTLDGGAIVADGLADVSTTESWSAMRVALGGPGSPDGAAANPPAAWARVALTEAAGGGGGRGGAWERAGGHGAESAGGAEQGRQPR